MVAQFRIPLNISKGTAVADGYRIAPDFNTLGATGVDATGLLISDSSYKNYGPGMLASPIATYNFTPFPTTVGNIVTNTAITGEQWLILSGDNGAVTRVAASNTNMFPPGTPTQPAAPNKFFLQMDWPRVPTITVAGANLAAPVNITFFGFDIHDKPLQHTYVVQNQGTYPGPVTNSAKTKGKAFYKITGVYFNGATAPGGTINCQVSNTFGLPYVLNSYSNIVNFGWNDQDMLTQGGSALLVAGNVTVQTPAVDAITLARTTLGGNSQQLTLAHLDNGGTTANVGSLFAGTVNLSSAQTIGNFAITSTNVADTAHVSWFISNGGAFITAEADTTLPTTVAYKAGLTGDVRGLFELPYLGETWAKVPDGSTKAIFSWYIDGFDRWINILNAGQQAQLNGIPYTFPDGTTNNIVPPNTIVQMYGLPQFYTGVPAS